jgi:hypothetical protein
LEVLIRAQDSSWPKGTPVVAKPDGWTWGTAERRPDFVVIRVPLAPGQEKRLARSDYELVEWQDEGATVATSSRYLRLRSVLVDVDALTPPGQDLYVLPVAEVLPLLTDAETGQPVTVQDLARNERRTVQQDVRTHPSAPLPPDLGGSQEMWDGFIRRLIDGDL